MQRALELSHRGRRRTCRCRPARTPSPLAIAHALQWGIPGHGSGRRRRQRPGSTRSPRPRSRLGGITGARYSSTRRLGRPMAKAGEIATKLATSYFDALARHDLDAATAVWKPGGVDRLVGDQELTAPDGIRRYFGELFAAFPDFAFEVLEITASGDRAAVRWRATATFAGPGYFQGFAPNHARIAIEGCDVVTVEDDLIVHNDAYIDSGDVARQLGLLPPTGSVAHQRLAKVANARTQGRGRHPRRPRRAGRRRRLADPRRLSAADDERLPDGGARGRRDRVRCRDRRRWLPGSPPRPRRLGGIKRVVLGHADPDHRGAAPALGAPVYCHEAERRRGRVRRVVPPLFRPQQAAALRAAVLRQDAAHLGRRRGRRSPETVSRGR